MAPTSRPQAFSGFRRLIRTGSAVLAGAIVLTAASAGVARADNSDEPTLLSPSWSFAGPLGTYDRGSLQRGFQVYKEVCAGCHGLHQLYYRDLSALGFSEDQVKALAASAEVQDGPNDQGEMFTRPGRPSDHIARPFPNEKAARAANNGALPPDQSLLVKARDGGADYLYSVLNGYADPPPGFKMGPNMYYNKYFPGHQIAMPPPLQDASVNYTDGTSNKLAQEAQDVVTFLTWAAEPEMEVRKQTGVKVVLFLLVMTGLFYASKRRIWAAVH